MLVRGVPSVFGGALRAAVLAVCAVMLLQASPAVAADRAFAPRFTANDTGNIVLAANSLESCPAATAGCPAAKLGPPSNTAASNPLSNNAYTMVYNDVDSDASTFSSSYADLAIPAGSTVLWAGLYWGGDYSGAGGTAAPNAAARNTMKFRRPGAASYADITASVIDESVLNIGRYQAFADVTALVTAGGAGLYYGANVQAGTASDHYAGWSLVVAYRNTSEPARNLTVFDGFKTIRTTDPPTDIVVSGFLTPPSGDVKSSVGVIAYEGDLGITGDTASLNGSVLSDADNPATNFFNSTIEPHTRKPSDPNNFGFDADIFATTNLLPNSSTSATLRLTTSGDQYLPGVLFFATELYAPDITQTKTVTDVNGGSTAPGDELEYTITTSNGNAAGTDAAANTILRDPIPADTTYVPGSISVATVGKTDTAGDDTAEFDAGNNRVVARIGSGATAAAGGRLAAGATAVVKFRVKVSASITDTRTITNTATASFNTEATGTPLTAQSSASREVIGTPQPPASADLSITKDADVASATPGQTVTYTLRVRNSGPGAAANVTVNDVLPGGLTFVSSAPGSPACSLAGASLTCSLGTIPSGEVRTVTIVTTVNPAGTAAADHQHQFRVERVQADLTLAAGQTGSVDVACPTGTFATDASVLILDNAGNVEDDILPTAARHNGDSYRVTVANPTATGNIQTRASVVCLGDRTLDAGTPSHAHPLLVSAPVTRTDTLAAGLTTLDLTCGPDQVAIAPSFAFAGAPVRVQGSLRNAGTGWRFILDSAGAATAELGVRCLDVRTGSVQGHVHDLALVQQTRLVSVPGGATVTERVECGDQGKGLVASFSLPVGLLALGNEPQPVNRDFRLVNTTADPLEARLGLLCLNDRTSTPPAATEIVNTATVSSTTPDPDDEDRTSTAVVALGDDGPVITFASGPIAQALGKVVAPLGAAPAPAVSAASLGKSALTLTISCAAACNGAVAVRTARTVRSGGVTLRSGALLGRKPFALKTPDRRDLRVALSKRKASALRRAGVKTVVVELTSGGKTTKTSAKLSRAAR